MKKLKPEYYRLLLFLAAATLMVVLSSTADPSFSDRYVLDVLSVLLAFLKFPEHRPAIVVVAVFPALSAFYYSWLAIGLPSGFPGGGLPEQWTLFLDIYILMQISATILASQICHFRNMKIILKGGTIWNSVVLHSNLLYSSCLALLILFHFLSNVCGTHLFFYCCRALLSCMILFVETLLVMRWLSHRVFILFPKKEEKIVECMRASVSELSGKQYNSLYSEIYDRILTYFEEYSPYLNPALTVVDVARDCFTNKVYLSRAINRCTGKNYCQFVNSYRVKYAINLFYKEPELRIADLAYRSGFHNVVTFNMAFHLYMNQTPSEWCRQERARLRNKKK